MLPGDWVIAVLLVLTSSGARIPDHALEGRWLTRRPLGPLPARLRVLRQPAIRPAARRSQASRRCQDLGDAPYRHAVLTLE